MKNVAFIFGAEGLFAKIWPVSFHTMTNLQRAIELLKEDNYCSVYVSLDHFDEEYKDYAKQYLEKYLQKNIDKSLQEKITVSASARHYAKALAQYLLQFSPQHVCLNIASRKHEVTMIEHSINAELDNYHTNNDVRPPVVLTKAMRS